MTGNGMVTCLPLIEAKWNSCPAATCSRIILAGSIFLPSFTWPSAWGPCAFDTLELNTMHTLKPSTSKDFKHLKGISLPEFAAKIRGRGESMKLEPLILKISGREPAGLFFKLHLVQLIIKSLHFQQFLVRTQFLDLALVEH